MFISGKSLSQNRLRTLFVYTNVKITFEENNYLYSKGNKYAALYKYMIDT